MHSAIILTCILSALSATIVQKHIKHPEYPYPTTFTKVGCWDEVGVPDLDWFLPIANDLKDYSKLLPGKIAQFTSGDGKTKVTVYGRSESAYLEAEGERKCENSSFAWRVATQAYHVHYEDGSLPGGFANWLLIMQPVYYSRDDQVRCDAQAILSPYDPRLRPESAFNVIASSPMGLDIGQAIFTAVETCDMKNVWPNGISFEYGKYLVKMIVRSSPALNFDDGFGMTAFFVAINQQDKQSGSFMAMVYPQYKVGSDNRAASLIHSRHSSIFVVPFAPDFNYSYLANPKP